jgi:superfamily II DNA/RNA helicase
MDCDSVGAGVPGLPTAAFRLRDRVAVSVFGRHALLPIASVGAATGMAAQRNQNMTFTELGLAAPILEAIAAAGYSEPTAVQAQAVPVALTGRDLMVSSQTGSGKTAAFMLPALQLLTVPHPAHGNGPRVLVLTPTRELSMQVTRASETYGRNLRRVKTVSIVGGMPYPVQNRMLKMGVDILVATPGRLLDQMNSGRVDLSRLQLLVLDEADRMLDMGFSEDLDAIVSKMPASRQTMLFSATMEPGIVRLATSMLKDPVRITVDSQQTPHVNIEQRMHIADDMGHKSRMLDHLLRDVDMKQAIVFTSTKRSADDLAQALLQSGFSAAALHGDMKQSQRSRTLQSLRSGGLRVLVATDVAARGIDVQGISHVFNFDLPRQAEDYVHRIGRTGRAGRQGIAISFIGIRDRGVVRTIERFTSQTIPITVVPGFEPRPRPASSPSYSRPYDRDRSGPSARRHTGPSAGRPGNPAAPGGPGGNFRHRDRTSAPAPRSRAYSRAD